MYLQYILYIYIAVSQEILPILHTLCVIKVALMIAILKSLNESLHDYIINMCVAFLLSCSLSK